ncbi:MAG TPA: DUF4845 domain-containing protein [Candidatus Competibacteraceae bacterium]|nr:DUF4845 domain-containing protein [Candidatus Competibacteraceae bacterium]HPF58681.1 DUF4845 domain-containing protein [Candidatus Competibacteraceae bacterium]HRY18610.1 DUF4845 domain-containing protein [Candidatus Competibacteraceae bacterium]
MIPTPPRTERKDQQRGMTVIGMLLVLILIAFAVLIAMKVIPIYIEYYTVKSTIESIRKEPQLAQMSTQDIHKAIQRRFDVGYVEKVNASDLKIKNAPDGRVLELVYDDERELFYGLFILLKVNETVPLTPN